MAKGKRATQQELKIRAAAALDMTHHVGLRGPKTINARERLALALDKGRRVLVPDIRWLEHVASIEPNPNLQSQAV